MWREILVSVSFLALGAAQAVQAQSADDANKSNNPLSLAPSLGLQNYYTPSLFRTNSHTNDFMLRPTLPIAPGDWVGVPQILRGTVPISTRPTQDSSYKTGLGDINVFDIFLLKTGEVDLGVGPMLTMPTGTSPELGAGKWSGGLAAVAVRPSKEGLVGGLLQWQHSFAGQNNRDAVHTGTLQPFLIRNLPGGWYLRSTGIWTFNLQKGQYYIPVGAGVGRAWRMGGTIVNTYIEPQWTVAHDGAGLPKFVVLAGVNFTFSH
ncbi:hypothetical protein [Achromobacter aloeverae]|uniref:Neuromedin U n=1 Tax=Achromobacter aloeverae TaxID=1750518 RepID=A0A4Q1HQR2_9BURK|nr:hypothetical protein [Achromobacter aloeverae]RXN92395.1 hypothetical protein C7R54_01155 [Achromobacter aloeverae]